MSCEAEFVGGPAHGQIRAFPGDEPPMSVVFSVASRIPWDRWNAELGAFEFDDPDQARTPSPLYTNFTYYREVSQMDDGPLWVYVPADAP